MKAFKPSNKSSFAAGLCRTTNQRFPLANHVMSAASTLLAMYYIFSLFQVLGSASGAVATSTSQQGNMNRNNEYQHLRESFPHMKLKPFADLEKSKGKLAVKRLFRVIIHNHNSSCHGEVFYSIMKLVGLLYPQYSPIEDIQFFVDYAVDFQAQWQSDKFDNSFKWKYMKTKPLFKVFVCFRSSINPLHREFPIPKCYFVKSIDSKPLNCLPAIFPHITSMLSSC